jgi:hypothetical protein
MKTFVLILMLSGAEKGALEKVEGFTSLESCQEAGKVFEDSWDAQYYYCLEVK